MKILITGVAGFIGFHAAQRLLSLGHEIVGVDNLNDYYDVSLKEGRLLILDQIEKFKFHRLDLADRSSISALFAAEEFEIVLHLGAQAGVRYSIENPFAYIDSNIVGTLTILEGCRATGVAHLIYASSSSVYGANLKQPFSNDDRVDHPISLYAATKKSNEMMASAYSHLYKIPATGLRFFTVYGPWGRPDMAYFKFANAICSGKSIDLYNNGDMQRDFTYIDDIVDGIESIVRRGAVGEGDSKHRVFNLGNNKPESLMSLVNSLEGLLGREAKKNFLPMQPGDVYATFADIDATHAAYGFSPKTSLSVGLEKFASWYLAYYLPKNRITT